MSGGLALWWRARTVRERRLLLAMLALAALVLGWLLVVRPLSDALEAAKTRHAAAVVALAEAKARVAVVGPGPVLLALPVDASIGRFASEAGFGTARIVSQGPSRASVVIDSARPQALFGWIARLEQQGLVVERLRARANPDRTVAAEFAVRARAG